MSDYPQDLQYTKEHEWARKAGDLVIVGVTFHAQEALGDVVYVELPKVGTAITQGKQFGVIESTKAVSELFAPITGKVVEVNVALTKTPDQVNADPYGAGWLVKVEPANPAEFDALLDSAAYVDLLKHT